MASDWCVGVCVSICAFVFNLVLAVVLYLYRIVFFFSGFVSSFVCFAWMIFWPVSCCCVTLYVYHVTLFHLLLFACLFFPLYHTRVYLLTPFSPWSPCLSVGTISNNQQILVQSIHPLSIHPPFHTKSLLWVLNMTPPNPTPPNPSTPCMATGRGTSAVFDRNLRCSVFYRGSPSSTGVSRRINWHKGQEWLMSTQNK